MTMSAPDDKISSNRRRLFKALSTAPVVMTLKPGAALANASSMQCLLKESGTVTQKFHLKPASAASCSPPGCFAYLEQVYWDLSSNTTVPAALQGKIVVETAVGTQSSNPWVMNTDGTGAGPLADLVTPGGFVYSVSGTTLNITPTAGSLIQLTGQYGLFLAIGGPDDPTSPHGFVATSVFPRGDTAGPLANDKLSGSCLHSFQQAASDFVLNNG